MTQVNIIPTGKSWWTDEGPIDLDEPDEKAKTAIRLDPVFQNEDAQKCWKGFFGWGIFYYKGKYFIVDEGWDLTSPKSPRNKYPDKTYNTISEVEQFFIDTWNDWDFETRITALSHLNADLKVSIQVELQ